tara:strand:+ start:6842 stop:8251 length:1410 start_codon:yes stop_codon:yes gene_type:complete
MIFEHQEFFMSIPKILILLPDGIGLRNFVYSDFYKTGINQQYKLTYWNATPFSLKSSGLEEIELRGKVHPKTDLLKRAYIENTLSAFEKNSGNPVFTLYRFPPAAKTWKQKIKKLLVRYYSYTHRDALKGLRTKMQQSERKTAYYRHCIATLTKEQPAFVFCTNQRPVNAIAPLTAARELGIPTATFIFSWDNLPKATMVVETDYYFVWSELMKNELLHYYPYIEKEQIIISGTPQFEMHFKPDIKQSREDFCKTHELDSTKKYICFSGDDVTTSPHDPEYLKDVAQVVRTLNSATDNWRIIFRRCPVDFSARYDTVLQEYAAEIYTLAPLWEKIGAGWNSVLPTREDNALLANTVAHCELLINVGSSMVFDAVCHHTPCAYIAYNPEGIPLQKDIHTIYKYIHFQSMPEDAPVFWLQNKKELPRILATLDQHKEKTVKAAQTWFQTINQHPPQKASERIWEGIKKILQ